jgi:hypothetical protein
MKLESMTKNERSLLLFFETCAVDQGGKVAFAHMNQQDYDKAKEWNELGFIRFGRIAFHDVINGKAYWCELSDKAWELAHQERKARYDRMSAKREWKRTEEQ